MIALCRYWLALVGRSQRFFAPTLLFVGGLLVLTTNETGPLSDCYGTAAGVLFLAAVWLTVSMRSAESREQEAVTAVSAANRLGPLTACAAALLLVCIAWTLLGLVVPIATGHHPLSVQGIVAGGLSPLTAALVGIAVGALCSRLVLPRPAWSIVAAIVLGTVVLRFRWSSPLYEVLALNARDEAPTRMLAPLAAAVLGAAAMLVAAGLVAHAIERLRA